MKNIFKKFKTVLMGKQGKNVYENTPREVSSERKYLESFSFVENVIEEKEVMGDIWFEIKLKGYENPVIALESYNSEGVGWLVWDKNAVEANVGEPQKFREKSLRGALWVFLVSIEMTYFSSLFYMIPSDKEGVIFYQHRFDAYKILIEENQNLKMITVRLVDSSDEILYTFSCHRMNRCLINIIEDSKDKMSERLLEYAVLLKVLQGDSTLGC